MWFAGAVLGLIFGAWVGGFSGAITGLLIGLFGGLWLGTMSSKSGDGDGQPERQPHASAGGGTIEEKFRHIYKALEDIHWRLERIEKREGLKPSPMAGSAGTMAPVKQSEVTTPNASPSLSPASAVEEPAPAMAGAMQTASKLEEPLVITPAPVNASGDAVAAMHTQDEELAASLAALSAIADSLQARVAAVDSAIAAPTDFTKETAASAAKPRDIKIPQYPQEPRTSQPPAQTSAPLGQPRLPRPPAAPRVLVPESTGPDFLERMLSGNIVAKIGVIILFFGVGFLLKFAYDRGMFPPSMRLLVVAATAGVMLFLGRKFLEKNRVFAIILLGGAMGLLYLDVFFALKTFALLNPTAAFGFFFLIGVAMTLMAVKMDAKVLAVLGLIGAFMAPILASTGSGNHVLLFSYYLLLNGFIFAVSWFKSWRELNLTGFIFTFAIALFWGNANYQPAYFNSVEPFLIAFFLLYIAIPILFAHRQPPELKGLADGTLIFGTPLSCAMMQAALSQGMGGHVLAWSAAGAALVYGVLAWIFSKRENMKLLAEVHLALSVVFATVAPYFAFNAYPTFAFWTLEGAAIYWLGCRQSRVLARSFGLLLQFGAAVYFFWHLSHAAPANAWFNDFTVGAALIALSSWITAWFMHRFADNLRAWETANEQTMIAWGALLWFVLGAYAIHFQWPEADFPHSTTATAMLVFVTASFALWEIVGSLLDWPKLRLTCAAHIVVVAILGFVQFHSGDAHPLASFGALAWPLTFVVFFFTLRRHQRDGLAQGNTHYALGWGLMIVLATWEAVWRYQHQEFAWVWAMAITGLIAAGVRYVMRERDTEAPKLPISLFALIWSLFWWFTAAHGYAFVHLQHVNFLPALLAYTAISVAVFELIGHKIGWLNLRRTQWLLPLAMAFVAFMLAIEQNHPGEGWGLIAWALAFGISYAVMWRHEDIDGGSLLDVQHLLTFWALFGVVTWEGLWQVEHHQLTRAWEYAVSGVLIAAAIAVLTWLLARAYLSSESDKSAHACWPVRTREATFTELALTPLLIAVLGWTLVANASSSGAAPPLPYLPVLNPLDITQLLLFAAAFYALRVVAPANKAYVFNVIFAITAFVWVNGVLLRTVHHWAGVPFEWHALMRSVVVQAAFSILWTLAALVLMFLSRPKASRMLWGAGALLLCAVVVKLFFYDLYNTDTIARVVSFLGVGVLLLIIGYVAPIPPSAATVEEKAAE